MIGIDFNGQIL